jgi:hypothetical protein
MAAPGLITKLFGSMADYVAGRLKTSAPISGGDAANKQYVDDIFATGQVVDLPKWMVGCPINWTSTVLPINACWPNGDFLSFADWPWLKEKYLAGGFEGMLLAYDAVAATIAANLGKWRPNAANPTGLFTPNLSDQFLRAWGSGLSREAGTAQGDAIQNITGMVTWYNNYGFMDINAPISGAFYRGTAHSRGPSVSESRSCNELGFNASNVVRTASDTHPQNISIPCIIYLGNQTAA